MSTLTCEVGQNTPSVCLCQWVENSYRLVSLWDIVKPFDARVFLASMRVLETVIQRPEAEINWEKAEVAISIIEKDCSNLGLTASIATIAKIQDLFSSSRSPEDFLRLISELQERILDETAAPRFFSLTDQEARHYNRPTDGWDHALARFPSAIIDVEEMNKCFALSRYAGCVFHSVQVIEHGLIEFGKWLPNLNDPKAGWTAVSNELARIVVTPYAKRTAFENTHFVFIEQMNSVVHSLKNAWRHKISHASGRLQVLSPDFVPDITEEIMMATRAFMRRFAQELPPTH